MIRLVCMWGEGKVVHLCYCILFICVPTAQVASVVNQLDAVYPDAAYGGNEWSRGSDILTHYVFSCSARRTAKLIASWGVPVWLYVFNYKLDFIESVILGLSFHARARSGGAASRSHRRRA